MFLQKLKSEFEEHLKDFLHDLPEKPIGLYDGIRHILDADAKRLRPIAVLLGYYLFKDDYQRAMPASLAVEVFHNFTLVHDDIMDEANVRRGKASVHQKFGKNTAMMVGDIMLITAYRILLHLDEEVDIDLVLELFSETAGQICEGQVLDMEFEQKAVITKEEYLNMVGLKTAVLLGLSFQLGAVIATDDFDKSEKLYQFGYKLGLAFQVMDDWIDAFGDEKKTGKRRGGDIYRKKKTWLWFSALEMADESDRAFLEELMEVDEVRERDVRRVLDIYHLYDIPSIVKDFADSLLEQTIDSIRDSDIQTERAEILIKLARDLVQRDR